MARPSLGRLLASSLTLVLFAACGGGGEAPTTPPPPTPTVQSVTVTPGSATLTAAGQTTSLVADVRLSNGSAGTQAVTWISSNGAVASVSGTGVVTAVASGTATITAAVGSVTGQATVTVAIPTVTSVTVTPATATLTAAGQTTTLTAAVGLSNGSAGTQAVTWSSSNTAVATVSAAGVVTAVTSGQATITAAVGAVSGQAAITVAIPTVASIAVTPATSTLVSLGASTTLTAAVVLSNGAAGTQRPTWSSSNAAVATVNNGTVTAVGNGTATIVATIGTVTGSATITVAQAVASVRLLPTDTVIKSATQLRGAALDARGNVIANAPLQWSAATPNLVTLSASGVVTPAATGVARVTVSAGSASTTAIVRAIGSIARPADLSPLFEYVASAGQRRARSDISQSHADARAVIMGQVWSYLETILPSSGSAVTDMYFTTWPEIFLEVSPFCGGVIFPNQDIYQGCNSPTWNHWIIGGTSPNDFVQITRWLSRQFLLSSMTTVAAFPWFLSGYTQWLGGGSFEGTQLVGAPLRAHILDFRAGDAQNLLVPLDTLVRTANTPFYENIALRTPVAVRMAQSGLFVAYLAKEYPTVIPAILARIRATPGAAFTNDLLLQEIITRTGKSLAELNTAYLAYARSLQP